MQSPSEFRTGMPTTRASSPADQRKAQKLPASSWLTVPAVQESTGGSPAATCKVVYATSFSKYAYAVTAAASLHTAEQALH